MTDSEINEVVARRLGWRFQENTVNGRWYRGELDKRQWGPFPDYYHDIKAAWDVVEKMQKQFDYVEVICADKADNGKWSCGARNSTIWQTWESADTAPMAICLAFLKLPDAQ